MNRPLLQLALDNTSMEDAINSLQTGVDEVVDIIECGTILLCAEGRSAVKKIRELYLEKLVVADFKISDSGNVMSGLLLDYKPDFVTCNASAHIGTIKAVIDEINKRGLNTKVQIELYGHWTNEDVKNWKEIGVKQLILHHSRDIKGGWSDEEITRAKELCDMGMEVTVTGSLEYEDIKRFKGIPIYCIIAGRSIRNATDPKAEAIKMIDTLKELWS